jgi:hypothetical protein
MTFTTLQFNGVEKCLADWGISAATRECANQAHDHFACDIMLSADAADPIPYGSPIILRIGRQAQSGGGVSPLTGLPVTGNTSWTGGTQWFVGWRVINFRTGSPALEKLDYKFAGPWEFFFERLIFQKLWWTWNGTANVADWRSQIVLGMSVNAEIGLNDTVPGSNATNLMSIRQQVAEIIAYVVNQTTADYGSPQLQSDNLTAEIDGVNYDLYETPGTNLVIPDYIAGAYAVSGKTSAATGATAANMQAVLRAPLDSVNDITCAEAMRRMLRWIGPLGTPVIWFDYTTSPPTLHISTRDQLPAVSLPLVGQNAGFKIKRRDDLIPGCIALQFRVQGNNNGVPYTEVIHDIAGLISGNVVEGIGPVSLLLTVQTFLTGSPAYVGGSANSATMQALQNAARDFAAVRATLDMEGESSKNAYCSIATAAIDTSTPAGGGSALAFWKAVFPELASISSPDFFTGSAVTAVDDGGNSLTVGSGSITDTNGNVYSYILTDGQIAPWMLAGNAAGGAGALSKQCTLTATFTGTENNNGVVTGHVQNHLKTARVTLVTIPGGTYSSQAVTFGEIIPYGLAGYIYNIEKIPQYEGTFTLQEQEITDQCPMGSNLNLTGSLAEWTTMNACVQQISYDLTAGKTRLTFGPAAHLGAKDLAERLRVNRGPRWYNLNGNNITNSPNQQPGTQLGNSVAQRGPSPGPRAADMQQFPISLADLAAHSYASGNPGATVDVRGSGQPNYGDISGLSAPNAPTIHLQAGSGGTPGACIRISIADLIGANKQAWFQPVTVCVNISGAPTAKTMYILCTAPE